MINIILEAYLKKQKEVKRNSRKVVLLITVLFSIILSALFVLSLKEDIIFLYVLDLAAIIIFLVWCIFVQKKDIERSGEHFTEYNESLDLLYNILEKELKDKEGKSVSWNSEQKIAHLIHEGEDWVASTETGKQNFINYVKAIIFPIIGFFAGLIAKKENADAVIILTIIILIMAVFCYGFVKIINEIIDAVFKSGSQREMKKLINMLKDLHARTYY